jgi:hypothetical protein
MEQRELRSYGKQHASEQLGQKKQQLSGSRELYFTMRRKRKYAKVPMERI